MMHGNSKHKKTHTETLRTTHSAIGKFHYLPYTLRFCIKDASAEILLYHCYPC